MTFCNLIGRQRFHDLIDAAPKLAEKLCVNGLQPQFKRLLKGFHQGFETNVDISNILNCSSVYRSVIYI